MHQLFIVAAPYPTAGWRVTVSAVPIMVGSTGLTASVLKFPPINRAHQFLKVPMLIPIQSEKNMVGSGYFWVIFPPQSAHRSLLYQSLICQASE